ncbi:hypothetical protein ACFL5Z_19950, partial [Planctomycetota bacterium]
MSGRIRKSPVVYAFLGFVILAGGTVKANWLETFEGNMFDLSTWQFHPYPDLTNSFTGAIQDGPDDNDYLLLDETSSSTIGDPEYGAQFDTWADLWQEACARAGMTFISIGSDNVEEPNDRTTLQNTLARESQQTAAALWLVLIGHGT